MFQSTGMSGLARIWYATSAPVARSRSANTSAVCERTSAIPWFAGTHRGPMSGFCGALDGSGWPVSSIELARVSVAPSPLSLLASHEVETSVESDTPPPVSDCSISARLRNSSACPTPIPRGASISITPPPSPSRIIDLAEVFADISREASMPAVRELE